MYGKAPAFGRGFGFKALGKKAQRFKYLKSS